MFGVTLADIWLVLMTAGALIGAELLLLSLYAPHFFINKFMTWLPDIIDALKDDEETNKAFDALMDKLGDKIGQMFQGYMGKAKQMLPKGKDVMMMMFAQFAQGWAQQRGLIPPQQ